MTLHLFVYDELNETMISTTELKFQTKLEQEVFSTALQYYTGRETRLTDGQIGCYTYYIKDINLI